jgi:hypothetical protein
MTKVGKLPALFISLYDSIIPKHCKFTKGDSYQRREGDSNPRSILRRTTVFETAAFDRSAISPVEVAKIHYF